MAATLQDAIKTQSLKREWHNFLDIASVAQTEQQ